MDPVLWGVAGGVLGEFANVYDHWNEDRDNLPGYLRRPSYYVICALMALSGGVIVQAHQDSGVDINAILALNVGITAPLILKALGRGPLSLSPGTTDQDDAPRVVDSGGDGGGPG